MIVHMMVPEYEEIVHTSIVRLWPNELGGLFSTTITYIREPTAGAYGTDFIPSPSEPDVGLSQRLM